MLFIFAALVLYSIAIIVGSVASRNANTNLVAGIINAVSAIIPFIIAVPFISRKNVTSHKYGIIMAVIAGMVIALFSMALTKSYSVNKVGIVAPVVFGGAILLSTLFSIIVFKDKTSATEITGLAILAIGLTIIVYARATAQ